MKIAKYFWDLNPKALKETRQILADPRHPKFVVRMVSFLSRCDKPRELFSLLTKKKFVAAWPDIKKYWFRVDKSSDFRDWWQSIYEGLLEEYGRKQNRPVGTAPVQFLRVGKMIKEARLRRRLSQRELSVMLGISQPDISNIEKGNNNITLERLTLICKALGIKKIEV
ncbi:MAG: helix-turn-helix transcriptional regulator [Candidatus Omnitrophica bacterium]|nr:helix-turn-helix transcriptional regulator [Candidatus Omnitrophota bacterium]